MRYRIRHRTVYRYEVPASVSHNVLFLTPRTSDRQKLLRHRVTVHPLPSYRARRIDIFGNGYDVIAVESPHRELKIVADSAVEVGPAPEVHSVVDIPFESAAAALRTPSDEVYLVAAEFTFPSPLVPRLPAAAQYAKSSFPPGRPILEGSIDLMGRIFREFTYDSRATSVSTPVAEVAKIRRGVCQDFAHFMIACLRSLGIAARYVSGYLETLPPPGKPRLVGADASHAWISVWVPGAGWTDLDPTNNLQPGERHVALAWGRDYQDVTPVRGVVLGGGADTLEVSVDVAPDVKS